MIDPNEQPPAAQRDVVSGKLKTWAFGTEKAVEVIEVKSRHNILIVVADDREGYVLTGVDCADFEAGDKGKITFTKGGPLGGYWNFTKD